MKLDNWCQAPWKRITGLWEARANAIYCDHGIQMLLKCCSLGVLESFLPQDFPMTWEYTGDPQTLSVSLVTPSDPWVAPGMWELAARPMGKEKMAESRNRGCESRVWKGEVPCPDGACVEWAGDAAEGVVGVKSNKSLSELCFLLLLHQRVSICFLFFFFLKIHPIFASQSCTNGIFFFPSGVFV